MRPMVVSYGVLSYMDSLPSGLITNMLMARSPGDEKYKQKNWMTAGSTGIWGMCDLLAC